MLQVREAAVLDLTYTGSFELSRVLGHQRVDMESDFIVICRRGNRIKNGKCKIQVDNKKGTDKEGRRKGGKEEDAESNGKEGTEGAKEHEKDRYERRNLEIT